MTRFLDMLISSIFKIIFSPCVHVIVCGWCLVGCLHSSVGSCQFLTSDPPAPYDSPSPVPALPPVVPGVVCSEDFCRLGCVCDSIRCSSPTDWRRRDHCGHADCMLDCTCTYRTRLRSGRMSLYDRDTAPGDDDPFPPDIRAVQPSVVRAPPYQSLPSKPPLKLRRLHRELTRLHVRSEQRALVGDYSAAAASTSEDGGLVRKSGRIRERERLSFSGFEKMKPLFLYDASFMLKDDASKGRRRKVVILVFTFSHFVDYYTFHVMTCHSLTHSLLRLTS